MTWMMALNPEFVSDATLFTGCWFIYSVIFIAVLTWQDQERIND